MKVRIWLVGVALYLLLMAGVLASAQEDVIAKGEEEEEEIDGTGVNADDKAGCASRKDMGKERLADELRPPVPGGQGRTPAQKRCVER